ncbi:GNAT family N-acetyltransferase [Rubrivivax sp. A210]|uniref:GNAT family N-acetyltransferase n=1 Tax=Rubrivivax sp. A210 TaxID=2772301 RepID=UPI00191B11BA|nr:GNAT family N-acetyltransferase [Rubrivivax sp. A210]
MALLFQTPRLLCRRWRRTDYGALYAVYSDPVAMRWVGEGKPITHEACAKWFEVTETNYSTRGYGMYAIEGKDAGKVIGFCGLIHPGGQEEVEVKYSFLRSEWGKGLASEILPALLEYGAKEHGLHRVIATVDEDHKASQRVLQKAGAKLHETRVEDDGGTTCVFEWRWQGAA